MEKEKFYLLIVGTRTHAFATSRFYKMFEECVDTLLQKQQDKEIVIVQGGCPTGGDYLARQYARIKGYKLEEFSADWEKYGKAATIINPIHFEGASIEYDLDFKIYGFEQSGEFNQDIEVVNGKIVKDELIEFDDYVWECIDPTIGG